MKNIIYSLLLFCLFSCSKETTSEPMLNDGQITLSLDLIREFSLQLDTSSSKSLQIEDSDFVHVYDSEITVHFTSVPPGYSESLTFNPNDNTQRVTLPYGEYNWEIPTEDNPAPISNTLSVSGQSTSVITINEPSVDLTLNVNTDYALVTVNDDYTSNVTLTHEDLSLSMNIKDGYNYGYVLSGTTSSSISVIDTNGDSYTTDLGLIQSCKHYKYQLDYSEVGVSSIICVCDPFEVIERFIQPSSGECGVWSKILNIDNMPSSFDLSDYNISTQFALNKNDLEFYIIDPSGRLITYNLSSNSFIEENVSFMINNMRDHIYNPSLNKIQYIRAGRETVYELDLNTLTSSISFNGGSDASHYNGIYFYNNLTSQIGHYGGYGFNRAKNSMANYSTSTSGWNISIPDSSTAPFRRFGGSRRWLLPNDDYTKLIIVGGVGNQSGVQGESCDDPLVTYNNDFCFLSDLWEINLVDYSVNQISNFDNDGFSSFGINGYDYETNLIVKYYGSEPYNNNNQHTINDDLKYFNIDSPSDGWILVEQSGDIPTFGDNNRGYFFYDETSNKFYLITDNGVWTLDMSCS